MEEIRRTAEAYYENLSDEKKRKAERFFEKMDKDKDKRINLDEYVEYLKNDKNTVLNDPRFFKKLDMNSDGSLDYNEAIVLYYIMQSGRALFCKSCDTFLAGAYFSCSQCFFKDSICYGICCDCYAGKKFTDHHSDAIFLDNYTLLLQSRKMVQTMPSKKREKVLHILKQGLQLASFSGALECFFNGGAGDDDWNCSIM